MFKQHSDQGPQESKVCWQNTTGRGRIRIRLTEAALTTTWLTGALSFRKVVKLLVLPMFVRSAWSICEGRNRGGRDTLANTW